MLTNQSSDETSPILGATDAPDPENHEPPPHLDSNDQISAMVNLAEVAPTLGDGDAPPVGHTRRDDADEGVPDPFTVDPSAPSSGQDFHSVFAGLKRAFPRGEHSDLRVMAYFLTSSKTLHVSQEEYDVVLARVRSTRPPVQVMPVSVAEAPVNEITSALSDEEDGEEDGNGDEGEDPTEELDREAATIPDTDDDLWIAYVHRLFNITGVVNRPHSRASANELVDRLFPGAEDGYGEAFVCALMGEKTVPAKNGKVVDLTCERLEIWVAEAREAREDALQREVFKSQVEAVVEGVLNTRPQQPLTNITPPWYRTVSGVMGTLAIMVIVLFTTFSIVQDRRVLRDLDQAAKGRYVHDTTAEVLRGASPPLVEVNNFSELLHKLNLSSNAGEREVQVLADVGQLKVQVKDLQRTRSAAEKRAEELTGQLASTTFERDQLAQERALDKVQVDKATASAGVAAGQATAASQSARRAEEALKTARLREAQTVLAAVQAGRCTKSPEDFMHPKKSGVWSKYNCGSGARPTFVLCDGRRPDASTSCDVID